MAKEENIMLNDGYSIKHHIDKELLEPGKKIKFGDGEYTLADINNLLPATENKVKLFIEWDNMCQYNAIGLVSVLNEITGEDRKLDIKSFYTRTEYPNGIDYVKNVIYHDCDNKLIDSVMLKYYPDITSRSPKTLFFTKLNLLRFMLDEVRFMFRYNHESIPELVREIQNTFFDNKIRCEYSIYPTEEDEIKNIKDNTLSDLYVVPDMGLYYKTFLDLKKDSVNILSYRDHNGLNPYILSFYLNEFVVNDLPGINNINLNFLEEIKIKDEVKNEN